MSFGHKGCIGIDWYCWQGLGKGGNTGHSCTWLATELSGRVVIGHVAAASISTTNVITHIRIACATDFIFTQWNVVVVGAALVARNRVICVRTTAYFAIWTVW
ncbi:hypothetical protein BpHYR1_020756 [Brachionus plicatilis]|uniref:Uncharacterized protein n=1 Tax=Brachionus plicatilis TaxID=10195 RepID=A0A3M7SLG0_BRAPC|nr:hypothetical protein BpHYR1_020756 [Brachionus plicatilis]